MADTIYPENVHIERPFGWKTWRVTPETLTGTTDVTVATLPAGTTILDAKLVSIVAGNATATAVDIEIGATGAGDTTLVGGLNGQDAGAVENTVTEANLSTVNGVSLGGSPLVVNAEIAYTGTATTAPQFEVHLLCGRNVLP